MLNDPLTFFSTFDEELNRAFESDEISKNLVEYCKEGQKIFSSFEDKAMKEEDILIGLKLFSASDTCNFLLTHASSKLEIAKETGENPKSLDELKEFLIAIIELGKRISGIFEGKGSREFEIKQIRELSLNLQEEAERDELLEPLVERLKKTPIEIRQSIVKRLAPE